MKAEDVGDIVNEIVKKEEKKDRRAQRLEAEGKSYALSTLKCYIKITRKTHKKHSS